jgi:hypothetical protein
MNNEKQIKVKSFYYKIFLAVLAIQFLNITYLIIRKMSGSVSFYYFSLDEKTILILLSFIVMPIAYGILTAVTLLLKKTNRNLILCSSVLSITCLLYIHHITSAAHYNYKHEKTIQNMNLDYYEWEENNNAPLGYPIDVYRGGFILKDGRFIGLNHGTSSGIDGWGSYGSGINHNVIALPDRINVIWLSYAENIFYKIDCPIDYDKIARLFKEGYEERGPKGTIKHVTYSRIIAGYTPGGVVVIWVFGGSKQIEIGRYQGQKIEIDQQEINGLDYPEKLFFKQSYRDEKMNNEYIVPTAVREANKNKPIPYGLWDTYREKYNWRPIYEQGLFLDSTFTVVTTRLELFNGEFEMPFGESLIKNEFAKRAIPKRVVFGWKDKNEQVYSGTLDFDEKEIFDAFKEVYKDNKEIQAELIFRVNIPNSYITILLKANGKEIALPKTKVDIFKSTKKF